MLPQQPLNDIALWTVVATTMSTALVSTVFVLAYSRHVWEATTAGRCIMAFAVAIMIRAWVALLARWDDYHSVDLSFLTWPLISISWLIITGVFAWGLRELVWKENDK